MDIAPHIPVIDKSKRDDGTFSRKDFTFDQERNVYVCPAGKTLTTSGKLVNDGETILYRAKSGHDACANNIAARNYRGTGVAHVYDLSVWTKIKTIAPLCYVA